MIKFKKYWFSIISIILMCVLGIYVCFFAIKKARNYEIYSEPSVETKIYTVWHIETFEGGGKARIDYLKTVARTIEKENAGILFMIKQINPENLGSELNSSKPDIISFGFGVGQVILPYLINLEQTYNVREELVESGMFNNFLYALPYIVSGYAEIKHTELANEFYCGINNYTKPENIYYNLNLTPSKTESQFDAYKHFVYNKKAFLLGTARDVFRVNNLNNIGRTNAIIKPVDSYSDLIQYIGLCLSDSITNKFVELLLSRDNQLSLVNYSLFSALHNKIYNLGIYNDIENAIFNCKIAKVFND